MGYQSCTRKRFSYSSKETSLTWNQKVDGKSYLGATSKKETRTWKETASISSKPLFKEMVRSCLFMYNIIAKWWQDSKMISRICKIYLVVFIVVVSVFS